MLSRFSCALICGWLAFTSAAVPADPGLRYHAQVSLNNNFAFDVQLAGDHARMDIQSSDDPNLAAGTSLLTSDGGETVVVLTPALQEYFSLPRSVISTFKQQQAEHLRVTADPISSEKVGEDQGPQIAGYGSRHLRFHLRMATHQPRPNGELLTTVDVFEHFWLAEQLPQHNTDLAVLADTSATGIPSLDEFLRTQVLGLPNFILKRNLVITIDDSLNHHQVERTAYEVTEVSVVEAPSAAFEIPEGFHVRDPRGAQPH